VRAAVSFGGSSLKLAVKIFSLLVTCLPLVVQANAQDSGIASITLSAEQVGKIKTALSISTRIAFPRNIKEIVCGDLYIEGKGTYLIQRGGSNNEPGNDFFIKPVSQSRTISNMFVRTDDGHVYNFDLTVVAKPELAHRTVNVYDPQPGSAKPRDGASGNGQPTGTNPENGPCPSEADLKKKEGEIVQAAQNKADDIVRRAREQANQIIIDAEAQRAEMNRDNGQRGSQEAETRFRQGIMGGIQSTSVKNTSATWDKVKIMLDPQMLTFDGKTYLRYILQNLRATDFAFTAIGLEVGSSKQTVAIEWTQSKSDNTLTTAESLTGVIVFDQKNVAPKDKVYLVLRGENDTEIGRINIQ
jgi:vacuolar-type H+-ATPase subunit H